MEFTQAVHEETFRRVREYLSELFDDPYCDPEEGHFYVRYGSTVLEISVEPYGEDEAVVVIMSYCVQGVELAEELFVLLLELNHQMAFGHFSLIDHDIFFSHSLLGRDLEPRDLLRMITAVAGTADDWDDRIVEKYGGQTALERIQHTGGPRRRRGETGEFDRPTDD
ncbi:MAG TPA: YbjN domain-containing protein [Thermoanaerobaculia bacterium]|nr:YbjN domain-containing protein [Thermoanaerobaculia bacterium]